MSTLIRRKYNQKHVNIVLDSNRFICSAYGNDINYYDNSKYISSKYIRNICGYRDITEYYVFFFSE